MEGKTKMMENMTLKELLENPLIKDIAPDAIRRRDLSKEEFYDWTLKDIAEKVGWGNLETGFTRLLDIAGRGDYFYRLYSDKECSDCPSRNNVNICFFPSDDEMANTRPFIFLIPGGGFVNVWSLTEGWPLANWFNGFGYNVFILTYQVGVDGSAVKAMHDMGRAFEIIQANKDKFNVDPGNYITCGFSAGGYITCLWNTEVGYSAYNINKPQACFPIYPATSFRIMDAEDWDEGEDKDAFARSAVGVSMQEACNSCFEIPMHVEGFPRTAIFVAAEDELVDPDHSRNLAEALKKAGIPCRLEVGPVGGHGFADGVGTCMEGWPQRAVEWFENE